MTDDDGKLIALTLRALTLLVAAMAPLAPGAEPATTGAATKPAATTSHGPAVTDPALDEALQAAMREQRGPRFEQVLQSVASRFPLVTVSTESGTTVWNKVTLNRRGKQIDAIRFRVPEGEPRDMLWAFLCNDLRYEWYILPVHGKMVGFRRNWYYQPKEILGDRAPPSSKDLVLQALDAASLKPGAEYIIWFKFRHAKPMPTYVAINLLPAVKDPATIEVPHYIASAIGLTRGGDPVTTIALDVPATTQPSTGSR